MMLYIGRRRCFAQMTKMFVLISVVVCCFILLNILCFTSVCELPDTSNPVWQDFGDVLVEANELSSIDKEQQSNARYNFVSNNQDLNPHNRELNVDRRLKLHNLTTLDFCPEEHVFTSNSTLMAGRRSSEGERFLVVGIPSITRKSTSYLNTTLTSIFGAINADEEKYVTIVVFLGDFVRNTKQHQVNYFSDNFKKYLASGMLQFITAPVDYYKPLQKLHITLDDEMSRVMWRSKQALDYSFLMCYCSSLSKYYLQLEDDVLASPSFVSKLIDFIGVHKEKWISFNVAHLGYIGKLYPASEIKNLASYIYLFFNDMPVDWLEPRWKKYRGQDPSKTVKRIASLFQHIGLHSSFKLKEVQRLNTLKEPHFDAFDHKYRGQNPPAKISSDLKPSIGQPVGAYEKGDGYFWGFCASAGSKVYNISLKKTASLHRIVVSTGSNFAPTNIILKGEVGISQSTDLSNSKQCSDFMTLGEFRLGQIDVRQHHKNVKCIQIKIRYQGRPILIREVNVWTS